MTAQRTFIGDLNEGVTRERLSQLQSHLTERGRQSFYEMAANLSPDDAQERRHFIEAMMATLPDHMRLDCAHEQIMNVSHSLRLAEYERDMKALGAL